MPRRERLPFISGALRGSQRESAVETGKGVQDLRSGNLRGDRSFTSVSVRAVRPSESGCFTITRNQWAVPMLA